MPPTEAKPCSTKTVETTDVLTQLESLESRSQINAESLFDSQMFKQIYLDDGSKSDDNNWENTKLNGSSSSDLSFLGEFPERRKAPDGAGNFSDETSVGKDTNVE